MVFGLGPVAWPVAEHCPSAVNPFSSVREREKPASYLAQSPHSASFHRSDTKTFCLKDETWSLQRWYITIVYFLGGGERTHKGVKIDFGGSKNILAIITMACGPPKLNTTQQKSYSLVFYFFSIEKLNWTKIN